jgi:hypothetical protein
MVKVASLTKVLNVSSSKQSFYVSDSHLRSVMAKT